MGNATHFLSKLVPVVFRVCSQGIHVESLGFFPSLHFQRFITEKSLVHIHNGVLAIKKNTFESVLMRWIKLEPIIQSEVSQKEKHQYSILTHIYGI